MKNEKWKMENEKWKMKNGLLRMDRYLVGISFPIFFPLRGRNDLPRNDMVSRLLGSRGGEMESGALSSPVSSWL